LAPRSKRSNSPLIHWRGTDAPRPVDQKPSAGWSRILLLLEGSRPTLSMAKFMRPYSLPRWFWRCSIRFSSTGGLTSPSGFSELVLSNSAWRGSRLGFSCRILRSNARLCGLFRRISCRLQEPSYRDSKSNQRRANRRGELADSPDSNGYREYLAKGARTCHVPLRSSVLLRSPSPRKDFRLVRRSVGGQPFCQAEGEKQGLKKQFLILGKSAYALPEVAIGYSCQNV
jgi:hypothetical protein